MAGLGGGDENALEFDRGEGLCNLVHIYIYFLKPELCTIL